MSTTTIPAPSAEYREEFATVTDLDAISAQAAKDQQAGIPVTTGREKYSSVAERAHYANAWLASMAANGPAKGFRR